MVEVSIIVTCYNKGKHLLETLSSIRSQNYTSFETIIIDDCSTDPKTIDILKNQTQKGETIVYLKKNIGVCEARNIGISRAQGDYILFVDGDDKISENYLQDTVPILKKQPSITVVTSEVELFGYKNGKMILLEPTIANMLAQNCLTVSSIFRKSFLDQSIKFNTNMNVGLEDWDFWLSILEKGGKIYKVPRVLFYYRISNKSRNVLSTEKLKKLRKQVYLNHPELFSKYMLDPTLSFEYFMIKDSAEYKVGQLILNPLRKIINFFQ